MINSKTGKENPYHEDPEFIKVVEEERAKHMGYTHPEENSVSMQGKQLAELLGVAPASLSEAAKKDHHCKGYRVSKWAVRNSKGKILSYHVPVNIYNNLSAKNPTAESHEKSQEDRKNPSTNGNPVLSDNNSPNQANEADKVLTEKAGKSDYDNVSLLPPDQNYAEPATAISLGMVGKSVVENDTGNSKAIIFTGSAGVGSWLGYKYSGTWQGALISGLLALGCAYLGNKAYEDSKDRRSQISDSMADNTPNEPNQANKAVPDRVELPPSGGNRFASSNGLFPNRTTGYLSK